MRPRARRPARWVPSRGEMRSRSVRKTREMRHRARAGQELFWGGAVCWWGGLREQLTPDPSRFATTDQLPGRGPPSRAITHPTAMQWSRHYIGELTGRLIEPEVMQKIPYMEMKLRIPEHLLMRVDKMTMAHSVEARVPFLDHDLVEFAMRVPPSYKLSDGLGKKILKQMAEPFRRSRPALPAQAGFRGAYGQVVPRPDVLATLSLRDGEFEPLHGGLY